ncbi:protein CURVATURE THYLAKOID 1B, chloroplastic-like [Senna tora]|uniref:Protein CURVATURE THYLAKOID 1B, chloroplastic-like n=1 Tax=Senna tora TaxID=362788 RepID=A0A834W017_9FABA|nr:protein CURVATURE THYLAKOID 1B, chloroplastic-like [Senna tora]
MASTPSSTTLTLSSSSSIIDPKLRRNSSPSSPQCVTIPSLPPPSRPWKTTSYSGKVARSVRTMATGETPAEVPTTELPEFVKPLLTTWEKVEDKYAVSLVIVAAVTALWASTGVISAIDRLPLLPGVLEIVGIVYSGWFAYKNLIYKPESFCGNGSVWLCGNNGVHYYYLPIFWDCLVAILQQLQAMFITPIMQPTRNAIRISNKELGNRVQAVGSLFLPLCVLQNRAFYHRVASQELHHPINHRRRVRVLAANQIHNVLPRQPRALARSGDRIEDAELGRSLHGHGGNHGCHQLHGGDEGCVFVVVVVVMGM